MRKAKIDKYIRQSERERGRDVKCQSTTIIDAYFPSNLVDTR